jgi:hypothetical protein
MSREPLSAEQRRGPRGEKAGAGKCAEGGEKVGGAGTICARRKHTWLALEIRGVASSANLNEIAPLGKGLV